MPPLQGHVAVIFNETLAAVAIFRDGRHEIHSSYLDTPYIVSVDEMGLQIERPNIHVKFILRTEYETYKAFGVPELELVTINPYDEYRAEYRWRLYIGTSI